MTTSSHKARLLAPILAAFAMIAPVALADWVAKDGTGTTITFEGFVTASGNLPKHMMTSPTGVQLGTASNPLATSLSSVSPSSVKAAQSGPWTAAMTQSGPWNATQSSPPLPVVPTAPLAASQSGAWAVGQSGTWAAGLNAGSNVVGGVTQSGSPWTYNLNQVGGAAPSLSNSAPVKLSLSSADLATGNPLPSNCVSGCTTAEGGGVTYGIGTTIAYTGSTGEVATLQGSATKTIKVLKVGLANGGAANSITTLINRRASANVGGTSTAVTIAKMDPTDPAPTAVVRAYTANPTSTGTDAGTIRALQTPANVVGASVNINPTQVYTFGGNGMKPLTLRGTSEFMAISFTSNTTGNARVNIEWTEE